MAEQHEHREHEVHEVDGVDGERVETTERTERVPREDHDDDTLDPIEEAEDDRPFETVEAEDDPIVNHGQDAFVADATGERYRELEHDAETIERQEPHAG